MLAWINDYIFIFGWTVSLINYWHGNNTGTFDNTHIFCAIAYNLFLFYY